MMTTKLIKIDDTTVAEISESRRIYSKKGLEEKKVNLESQIAKVEELLAILTE